MKTSRVTRRVVRRWIPRLRTAPVEHFVTMVRLAMPQRERDVLHALIARELSRRDRLFSRGDT